MSVNVQNHIEKLINTLNSNVFDKEKAIKLAVLAILSGESIFLLGPPGVAKSLVSDLVTKIFKDGCSFNYLMSKFSTPEEIYGPISIKKLKDEDKYERKIEDYLPTADVAFLDEIWKSSPAIQNTLLTAINEKIMLNGGKVVDLKLKGIISASNELPPTNEGLEALWDRFIIRLYVDNISNQDLFLDYLENESTIDINQEIKPYQISEQDYKNYLQEIEKINLTIQAKATLINIKFKVNAYNNNVDSDQDKIYISDRRWKKIIQVLKASAFYNNNDQVSLMDCVLVSNMIWENSQQIPIVKDIVLESIKNTTTDFYNNFTISNKDYDKFCYETESIDITCNEVDTSIKNNTSKFVLKKMLLLEIDKIKSQIVSLKKVIDQEKDKLYEFHLRKNIFLTEAEFKLGSETILNTYYKRIKDLDDLIASLDKSKGVVDGY